MTTPTVQDIQATLNRMENDLFERGFSLPEATLTIGASTFHAYLSGGSHSDDTRFCHYIPADEDFSVVMANLEQKFEKVGTVTKIKTQNLRAKLAEVKEAAEALSLDVPELNDAILNPLTAMMKALSENIIEDQRAPSAAE